MRKHITLIKKIAAAVVLASTIMTAASPLTVHAAGVTPRTKLQVFGPKGEGFHARRYAQEYPDLMAAFGTNHAALWNHYVNYGFYEGRMAYPTTRSASAQLLIFALVEQATTPDMSEREKVKAIHDFMIRFIDYDYENYRRGTIPKESYDIEGTMHNQRAVCQGYAYVFDYAMSILGIDCEVVCGLANGGSHAWNRVFIEGQWLYVDVTWDDPYSSSGNNTTPSYRYFLLTQAQMNVNRAEWEIRTVY